MATRRLSQPLWLLAATCLLISVVHAQELASDTPLDQLTPSQRLSRRITPEVLVVQAATPAVVFIETDTPVVHRDIWGRAFRQNLPGSGSGVVLSSDGFIVTNYHVVKDATNIRVSFEKSIDERIYEADVLSFVANEDLALLKIRDAEDLQFETIPMGTSSDLMTGERVIAIGNPYGHTHTVSVGIISGLHRDVKIEDASRRTTLTFDDLIQTDASINPGNSGGPLLNINGELIGINNAVKQGAENIGFAIPIDRVKEVLQEQLISPDRHNAWMGFEIEEDETLTVSRVLEGGPAAKAGLRVGDRIQQIGGSTMDSLEAYQLARVALSPGQIAEMRVKRGRRNMAIPVQAWTKADGLIYERFGAQIDEISRAGRGGLRLASLLPEGPAQQIGLLEGDVVTALRPQMGTPSRAFRFPDRTALARFLDRLAPETKLAIEIQRKGQLYQGTIVLR